MTTQITRQPSDPDFARWDAALGLATTGVEMGIDAVQWTAEIGLAFNPITLALEAIFEILEITGVIPDPLSLLIGAFYGIPKNYKTERLGAEIAAHKNTIIRMWGMAIYYAAKNGGFVVSRSSDFPAMWGPLIQETSYALGLNERGSIRFADFFYRMNNFPAPPGFPFDDQLYLQTPDRPQNPVKPGYMAGTDTLNREYVDYMYRMKIADQIPQWLRGVQPHPDWQQRIHMEFVGQQIWPGAKPKPAPQPIQIYDDINDNLKAGFQTIEDNLSTLKAGILPRQPGDLPESQSALADQLAGQLDDVDDTLVKILDRLEKGIPVTVGASEPPAPPVVNIDLTPLVDILTSINVTVQGIGYDDTDLVDCICPTLARIADAMERLPNQLDLSHLNAAADQAVQGGQAKQALISAVDQDLQARWSVVGSQ